MQVLKSTPTLLVTQPDYTAASLAGIIRTTCTSRTMPGTMAIHMEACFSPHADQDRIAIYLHPPGNASDEKIYEYFPTLTDMFEHNIRQNFSDDAMHGQRMDRAHSNMGVPVYCSDNHTIDYLPPTYPFPHPDALFDALEAEPQRYNIDPAVVREARQIYRALAQVTEKGRFIDRTLSDKCRLLKNPGEFLSAT